MQKLHYIITMIGKMIDIRIRKKGGKISPSYLKYRIFVADTTQRRIAKKLGVSDALVSRVIRGERKNEKIIEYIMNLPEK